MEDKESTPEELAVAEQDRVAKQAQRNPIITPGDPERFPLLEMPSQMCSIPVTPADEEAIMRMDEILDILDEEAAGLAAVQIGFPRRIFLLRNSTNSAGEAENNVYINPAIISKSRETKKAPEGCLSLPGMGAVFPRSKSVVLEYMDLAGDIHTETFSGFWARAVQHEIDHLNGVLITRHLEKQATRQSGMQNTSQRKKAIAKRRAKKKRARRARRG